MIKRIFLTISRAHGPVLSPLANLHPALYILHSTSYTLAKYIVSKN